MSNVFGAVLQQGYVVPDIDAAMKHWIARGIGPFYMEHLKEFPGELDGKPVKLELKAGFAYSGDQQIEVIEPIGPVPSIYSEYLKDHPEGGLQHLAVFCDGAIQEKLDEIMHGKTVLVVAHRLSTVAHLDRILVFDNGRLIEDGSHAHLLRQLVELGGVARDVDRIGDDALHGLLRDLLDLALPSGLEGFAGGDGDFGARDRDRQDRVRARVGRRHHVDHAREVDPQRIDVEVRQPGLAGEPLRERLEVEQATIGLRRSIVHLRQHRQNWVMTFATWPPRIITLRRPLL